MSFKLENIVRENVKALQPYASARNEFNGIAEVSLDANENPFGFGLNRYPDSSLRKLKKAFSDFRNVDQNRLIFGNGSDEIIDLLIRAFCEPGLDQILTFPPTFGMYSVSAAVNNVENLQIPLKANFQVDEEQVRTLLHSEILKLIFFCSPNNPTGNQMSVDFIKETCGLFKGIVVVDEAYVDFSGGSLVHEQFPNLFILQTFSKTFGLAGARLGVGIGTKDTISVLDKIKPPYNINSLTEQQGLAVLQRPELIRSQIEILKKEKDKLETNLKKLNQVKKVYPSDANFLLVHFEDAEATYDALLSKGIVVRNRSRQVADTLRITIGTPEENDRLLAALEGREEQSDGRVGHCLRTTSETKIAVHVNLDDPSGAAITTGIAFFDHMLDQIARHGSIGLKVQVEGDLHIDPHHTIEDTALALGSAFDDALRDRRGMERYGFLLPMDDSLAQVAIDFGGRPWLEWDAEFSATHVGEMPTEMVSHFFKSFSDTARCNLNIKVEGENDHHKIESIFKAFARAIKMAVKKDASGSLPSTKGVL
ncbi:MAG: histidinol-phosphate transaminase [Bacteroidota bacterium]